MNYQYSDLIDEYVEQEIEKIRLQRAIAEERQAIAEEKLLMVEKRLSMAEKEAEISTNCILSLIKHGIVTVEQIAEIMSMSSQNFIDKYGGL